MSGSSIQPLFWFKIVKSLFAYCRNKVLVCSRAPLPTLPTDLRTHDHDNSTTLKVSYDASCKQADSAQDAGYDIKPEKFLKENEMKLVYLCIFLYSKYLYIL